MRISRIKEVLCLTQKTFIFLQESLMTRELGNKNSAVHEGFKLTN